LIPKELKQQIDSNKKQLSDTERNITQQKAILNKQLQNLIEYQKLATNGYVSSVELLTYQEKAASLEKTIGQSEAELNSLIAKRDSNRRELANNLNETRSNLANADATAKVRSYKLKMARSLKSPINGMVVQITTWPGSVVTEGQEMFVLSEKKGKLTTSFLITGADAGRIRPGNQALISPSSAPPQRFGYIKGIVRKVSPFPTNQAAYGSLIGSQSLAQQVFSSQESKLPFLVEIEPIYSNGHLAWSGSSGPPWQIVSGSVAEVKVIYQSRLPITYVIPWLKNATGLSNF
jgi:HlyD family secretion protein